ncbi:MAG: hypothetical protein E7Z89_04480 [Cyanobacteria bacterium SIG28]|nr:hypothetical protein [Cyanobacteria bacterium SIG28]
MKILNLYAQNSYVTTGFRDNNNDKYNNFGRLNQPSLSFWGMKKNQFSGINKACVKKFSAPIEKFNNILDLQTWAKLKRNEFINKNFKARRSETEHQRKEILEVWLDYLINENQEYTPVMGLMILAMLTKNLKPNNDNLPPILNKGVLADTVETVKDLEECDIEKIYLNKLQQYYLDDENAIETGNSETGWVIIPSRKNDPENFEANVEKLRTLSHKSWCTKALNARPYLSDGDFHIYLEKGEPKLGIRFKRDGVEEIQGEKNDGKIPIKYLDELKKHQQDCNLTFNNNAKTRLDDAKQLKLEIDKIKKEIGEDAIKNTDSEKILRYFGCNPQKTSDGKLIIDNYNQPTFVTYADLGIDENKMFKDIVKIKGDISFPSLNITDLGSLTEIGGNVYFGYSKIKDLGNLTVIGGNAIFSYSKIKDLGNLSKIGGNVVFINSEIESLGNVTEIDGDADFCCSNIKTLSKLKKIGKNAIFRYSLVEDLGELTKIGGNAIFTCSRIKSLNKLTEIDGNADFICSEVEDLGDLTKICGNVYVDNECKFRDCIDKVEVGGEVINK